MPRSIELKDASVAVESNLIEKSSDSSPNYKSHGILWTFILECPTILAALIIGLSFILATFGYTYWLSYQNLLCPPWAIGCKVVSLWGSEEPQSALPLIQGFVSFGHGLGLATLFYVAATFAEPTLWPLLSRKPYTLATPDAYLQGTRGSLPSLFEALFQIKDYFAVVVLLFLVLVVALGQLDRVIIGQVYSLQNTTKTYQSSYLSGGGIGIELPNSTSAGPLADPAINGFAFYTSWAKSLSDETLPDMREFIVDRYNLSALESFTISALKAQKTITCSSRPLNISDGPGDTYRVAAEGSKTSVPIRTDPRLSCWVDSSRSTSSTTSITAIMFAARNGFIEGGAAAEFSHYNITSLQCDVKTELIQSTCFKGTGGPNITQLSSIATLHAPGDDSINLAKWMGGAVTFFGVRVYNARPMFGVGLSNNEYDPTMLPQVYATVYYPDGFGWDINYWTQSALKNFVNVTSGAVAIAISKQMNNDTVIIRSNFSIPKLSTPLSCLLLLPTGLILAVIAALCWINRWSYKGARIERIRLATIPEWTKSSHMAGLNQEILPGETKPSDDISKARPKEVRYRLRRTGHEEWGLEVE